MLADSRDLSAVIGKERLVVCRRSRVVAAGALRFDSWNFSAVSVVLFSLANSRQKGASMVEWFEIVLVFDEERALEYHSIIGPIDLVMRSFDEAYMALHSDGPITRFDLEADRRPNLIALRRKDETEWIAEMALHLDAEPS